MGRKERGREDDMMDCVNLGSQLQCNGELIFSPAKSRAVGL